MTNVNPFDAYLQYSKESLDLPIEFATPTQSNTSWQSHQTPTGKQYYYNPTTQQTTWDKPFELMSDLEKELDALDWKELESDQGKKYYFQKSTRATTWKVPDEWKVIVDKHALIQERMKKAQESLSTIPLYRPVLNPNFCSNYDYELNFDSQQEREKAFNAVLAEADTPIGCSWDQVLHQIINHSNYRALRTLAERKVAFTAFMEQKKRQEGEGNRRRMEKNRTEFRAVLTRRRDITHESRWRFVLFKKIRVVSDSFKHESVMRKMKGNEAQVLFNEYIMERKQEHREQVRKRHKQNIQKLSLLFNKLYDEGVLDLKTRWRVAEAAIISHSDFKNDGNLIQLEPLDLLVHFEEFIKSLESRYNSARHADRSKARRLEREKRGEFKRVLQSLDMNHTTKWKEIYPLVKDQMQEMLGQTGSTPLDLYFDHIVLLEDYYLHDKHFITSRVTITLETRLKDLDIDVKKLKLPSSLTLVYNQMIKNALDKKENAIKKLERDFMRLLDSLHLTVPVKWIDVYDKIKDSREFSGLGGRECEYLFDLYVRELIERGEDHGRRRRKIIDDERRESIIDDEKFGLIHAGEQVTDHDMREVDERILHDAREGKRAKRVDHDLDGLKSFNNEGKRLKKDRRDESDEEGAYEDK